MLDFFNHLNSAKRFWTGDAAERAADEYANYSRQSIVRQYIGDAANKARGPLRLSSLGKPAVETAAKIPAVRDELSSWGFENHPFDETMRHVFTQGDAFENWVGFQLRRLGYTIHECGPCSSDGQHMAEYEGVPGHLDFIVTDPDGYKFVLEVKTMSTYYFKQFFDLRYSDTDMFIVKDGIGDDDRGYLTQLSTYMEHTGLPGYWLALDKGTRQLAVGSPHPDDVEAALARASRIIPIIQKIETLQDVFLRLNPPPGEPEVFKKQLTGRLKLPTTMAYWHYREVFYNIQHDKNGYKKSTEYIGEYNVDEYIDLLASDPTEAERLRFLMHYTDKSTYEANVRQYTSGAEPF